MNLPSIDHILTTTRSVRKRLDLTRPVEPRVIQECLQIAIQAPTGSNAQHWHFMVVTEADKRRGLADLYRQAFASYNANRSVSATSNQAQLMRVIDSAMHLSRHMHEVPVMVIPCIQGRVEGLPLARQASMYGSILPAAWSFMLALRARGLGAAWTTLHLVYEKEAADLLGIPPDVTQTALLPVAYYTGDDFQPAKRQPATEFTYWNSWGHQLT